jgi:hypothetical protein
METTSPTHIAIRLATDEDTPTLIRLAALDSAAAPLTGALVADFDGEIVAAKPLNGNRVIADPFRRTADIRELLELRARPAA